LAGLKWTDIDFLNLQIDVSRSVVDQHVGRCKTEISQKQVPINEYIAADLLEWYRQTPYHPPTDWVFATDSNRAGEKRGKQPLWLSKVMGYHIQPVARKLGIQKRIGWHRFRRTLFEHPQRQRRGCEGGAGAIAARFHEGDVGSQAGSPAQLC
jgi:integrase